MLFYINFWICCHFKFFVHRRNFGNAIGCAVFSHLQKETAALVKILRHQTYNRYSRVMFMLSWRYIKCTQQECVMRCVTFYLKLVLGHCKVLSNVVIYLRRVIRKKKINNTDEEIIPETAYARIYHQWYSADVWSELSC